MYKSILLRLLFFLLPILLLIGLFFIGDPFRIIYDYENYSMDGQKNYVTVNSDFVATKVFLKNYQTLKYNSFIFGNSSTVAFHPTEWKKHLHEKSEAFVFNANNETLFGILGKLKLIEEKKCQISNVFIPFDRWTLQKNKNSTGHLFIKHPAVSGESWFDFYTAFFNAYLGNFFFVKYLDYILLKTYRPYMAGSIDIREILIDPVSNATVFTFFEKELTDSIGFYEKHKSAFYSRPAQEGEGDAVINQSSLALIKEIKNCLQRNHTNYKIIINPLYDQLKLNMQDINILKDIFGSENVFDFSGKNSYTDNIGYYYEAAHFRPLLGNEVFKQVYK